MDETADQIEAHIDRTRERLGTNLTELEDKVEAATDWRTYLRERPYVVLGAALIGAMVLASAFKSKSSSRPLSGVAVNPAMGGHGAAQARELWNNVQGALVGMATAQIKNYISGLVPDFHEHYRRAEQRAAAANPTTSSHGRTTG